MNPEKIERVRGDLNLDMNSLNNLRIQSKYVSEQQSSMNSTQNTKTKSLSLLSDKQEDLNVEDIIPFYNQIDKNLFSNFINRKCIYSEMKEYDNIEQIRNQRILIQQNNSSKITCVMDIIASQLMVTKEIETFSLDNAIQKLDEYKIHYSMNQIYPQTSLKLFIPVQITKQDENYRLVACMERAQFNLFDYSRKYLITKDHAYDILLQILKQIINMHSINIAHRDIKPQNILYVLGKGWLLSDYGESQQYQEVDSFYNIRGTIYFLLPSLKSQITKNKMMKQNLLFNDIYALVISIIMIQSQEYITNIQEEIDQSNDQLLIELLKIKGLNDVEIVLKLNNIQMSEKYQINESPIYMNLNQYDTQQNQKMIHKSCIQLYCQYYKNKVKVKLMNQLLELIEKYINKNQIMTLDSEIIGILYNQFFRGFFQFNQMEPSRYIKHFNEYNLDKQKLIVNILFQFGFNEKTIFYGKKILKQSYCQNVHLKIILCYSRILMDEHYKNELILFAQQLQLNQLDTYCQLDYLQTYKNEYLQQNANQRIPLIDYLNKINQKSQNNQLTFVLLYKYLTIYIFTPNMRENLSIITEVIEYTYLIPMQQQQKFYEEVLLNLYFERIDRNTRINLEYDLAEIYFLLNFQQQLRQNLKKVRKMMFDPDSYEQVICCQIQNSLQKIRFQHPCKNKKFNQYIKKIFCLIQIVQKVKIIRYKLWITQNLLRIIEQLFDLQIQFQNHTILYIIQFGIEQVIFCQNNYHLHRYDHFIVYTKLVLEILFELRNRKRMVAFINKYDLRSNNFANQFISRIRNNLILGSLKSNLENKYQNFRETLHQKFIYQQYLDRQ